jgi:hypothetical protein
VELLDTRGPEHLRGPMLVPLQKVFTDSAGLTDAAVLERLPAEANAEPGREVRGHAGEKETVGREIHLQAIRPEDLTALVCGHEARAVTDWDNETGILKALRYEHVEQAR